MDELSALPESVWKLALDRFRLLEPHLEQNRPLRPIAIEAGIPYRTAQRWVTRFQRFGLAALLRKKRTDAGARRAVPIKMKAAIEGLALQKPPLPITALHRQVQRFSLNLGEKAPSYKVVYSIVRGLPADLLTLAHEGTKAYSEAFDLVHRREAAGPNAIWQADHSPLDILLVRVGGDPEKPWLTIVMDDYSRAVAGYLLSFEPPSTLHTSLALRQGIWRKDDLSARGVTVHGIDASPAMIRKVRTKPGGEKIPVTLGDFADVPVQGLFNLIYVVFNTFFALLTQEAQ